MSKDDTILLDGGGDKTIIEDRTEQVLYLRYDHVPHIFMWRLSNIIFKFSNPVGTFLGIMAFKKCSCTVCGLLEFLVDSCLSLGTDCGSDSPNYD